MLQSPLPAPHEIPEKSSVEAVSLQELESPTVKLGVDYWRAQCGGRRYPTRGDLRPREMAGALRNMMLVKVLDGGADYEFRIVGDAQVKAYAMTLQSRRLSQVGAEAPTFADIVHGIYAHVVQTGEPFAVRGRVGRDVPEANFIYNESVFLPLGANDGAVDHLLVVSTYVMRTFATNWYAPSALTVTARRTEAR